MPHCVLDVSVDEQQQHQQRLCRDGIDYAWCLLVAKVASFKCEK
jgi:hypothetical protein